MKIVKDKALVLKTRRPELVTDAIKKLQTCRGSEWSSRVSG
jgi:hypothetical protein